MDQVEETRSVISNNTIILTLSRQITYAEQGTYIEVPFEMPDRVEDIHVAFQVTSYGETKAVIDLGIRDNLRVRGWSGGARTEFQLGLEKATPGYMPGELQPGTWAVIHNAYKVPKEGCKVTLNVQLRLKALRWLKGDLHMHSVHSDGKFTLEENAAVMERLDCDFMAMTDHNTVSQNFSYPRNTDVVMIPGMEFTTNYGHSNFLGISDPLDDFRVRDQTDVNERIRTARERGARIVLNHPHCDFCPWEWSWDVDYDWVEVWNGPWSERNARALQWWQEQLVSGRRIPVVGGSDTHRPDPYVKHAMPCTWVYAESRTTEGILRAIGRGHVCLSFAPAGPFVELTCGAYRTGDIVPALAAGEGSMSVKLQAKQLRPGDRIRWISNHGVEQEISLTGDEGGDVVEVVELAAEPVDRTFCRVEVWRYFEEAGQMLMAALTNPIYFER